MSRLDPASLGPHRIHLAIAVGLGVLALAAGIGFGIAFLPLVLCLGMIGAMVLFMRRG